MSNSHISVNYEALKLIEDLRRDSDKYGVIFKKTHLDANLIDAGIKARGGFSAGRIITEICMGGLGSAEITYKNYGDISLPTITVTTDHPAISTLGSQLAGWRIKTEKYSAIGSGPARALALKPRSIYREIGYRDEAESAILVLESSREPPEEVISDISTKCKIEPENLFLITGPTSSIAGLTQISGRIVETGMHRLSKLGLDPNKILYACGSAPIMPIHPDPVEAMGRANDAILYGGATYYVVADIGDDEIRKIIGRAVSSASKQYGEPFKKIFEKAGFDFYKVDSNLFAPASITINNIETGRVFKAGKISPEILEKSLTAIQ